MFGGAEAVEADMKRKKLQIIKLKEYGDAWINRLAQLENAFSKMDYRERQAALEWLISKYKPK